MPVSCKQLNVFTIHIHRNNIMIGSASDNRGGLEELGFERRPNLKESLCGKVIIYMLTIVCLEYQVYMVII